MTTEVVTLPQAAELLGVPWYVARRLAANGSLGHIDKFGDRLMLDRASVLEYGARHAKSLTGSPSPTPLAGQLAESPDAVDANADVRE